MAGERAAGGGVRGGEGLQGFDSAVGRFAAEGRDIIEAAATPPDGAEGCREQAHRSAAISARVGRTHHASRLARQASRPQFGRSLRILLPPFVLAAGGTNPKLQTHGPDNRVSPESNAGDKREESISAMAA